MARMLERLVRVRMLLEEAALAHLEQQAQVSAQADQDLSRESACAARLRAEGFAPLLQAERPGASGGTGYPDMGLIEDRLDAESRYLAEQERATVAIRKEALARTAEQENERLLLCREAFLGRRRERQQLETLTEAARWHHNAEQTRREQRTIDDWFAAGRVRQWKQRVGGR